MMYLIFALPVVVCLCLAVVQAMRGLWKNMVIALLCGVIFLQFVYYVVQSNNNVNLRARNNYLTNKTSYLEQQLNEIRSNQASKVIATPGEPQPQR
jgi:uncharacterized membrane protein YukC